MREQRVAEEIREDISDILRKQVKDPQVGFCSITSVDVTKDLRFAKIHVSVLGDDQEKAQVMKALQRAAGYIRSELASRLTLRCVPELAFKLDNSIEHGLKIAKLLNQMQETSSRSKPDDGK